MIITIKTDNHPVTGQPETKEVDEWQMMVLGKYKSLQVQARQASTSFGRTIIENTAIGRALELLHDPITPWTKEELECNWVVE